MTAFLMVLMMAVLAFSVDVGYLFALKTELKRYADAAALAGAAALYDQTRMQTELYEYEHTVIPPEPEAARFEGQKFAGRNPAGNRKLQLDTNAGNLLDGEIVIGCLSAGQTPPLRPTLSEPQPAPAHTNIVKLTADAIKGAYFNVPGAGTVTDYEEDTRRVFRRIADDRPLILVK